MKTGSECRTGLVVKNRYGLHARPAALLVKTARMFAAEIRIVCDNVQADAKSILGVITLCATQGAELVVTAKGADAEDAIQAITELGQSSEWMRHEQ